MPILFVLGAAAIISSATYLVPLIITCVASAVTIVVTFVGTRAYYKQDNAKDTEMQNLKKEQAKRDAAVRDEVSRIAEETGVNIQTLLELSQEQQTELKRTIQEFMQNIEDSDRATQSLNELAHSIQAATNNASLQQSDLYTELEQMKTELQNVQHKLCDTERALADKESELQQTIETLSELIDKINDSGITENAQSTAEKDVEIMRLRAKNTTLNNTIVTLDTSIKDLQDKLTNSTEMEKLQIQEIQELIGENKRLTATIESLADSMECNTAKATQLTNNTSHQLRMFK